MHIPYTMLEAPTLRNLIESFVTREGTDYGEREYSLDAKIDQVLRLLQSGEAQVVYDEESESCSVIRS